MIKIFVAIVAAIALSAFGAVAVVHRAGPSTAELDVEIASLNAEISAANSQDAQYFSGIILAQTQLQVAILKNTLAMLQQKRESFLRGITLHYQEPSPRISAPSDDAATLSELDKARSDVKAAQREATMYSGGLIQTLALVREATAKTTEAAIEQRIVLMKLGIPLPSLSGTTLAVPKSPGKTTSDKNAL
jgi:hypothetical protein